MEILKMKVWDFVPVLGFFVLTITEGKSYWLAGFMTIIWLAIIGFRWFLTPKK